MSSGRRQIKKVVPAGEGYHVAAAGEFVHLKSSTGALLIEIEQGGTVEMSEGDKQRETKGFKGFYVTNAGVSDVTVVFVVGYGDYTPGQLVGSVTIATPSVLVEVADVNMITGATVQVVYANALRKEAIIHLIDTATGYIRWGSASVGASRGQPLYPGQTVTINLAGDIWLHNPNAGAVDVAVSEIRI